MNTPYAWLSLPHEIRESILQLICDSSPAAASDRYGSGLAHLASVCENWRVFFERYIFRRIIVSDNDLYVLARIIRGAGSVRLSYIQYLWLRIELAPYDCKECGNLENAHTITTNDRIFTSAIRRLMAILSSCPQQGPTFSSPHLSLEISAASPSDTEHEARFVELEQSYPFHFKEDLAQSPNLFDYMNQKLSMTRSSPHWINSPARLNGSWEGVRRVFGTPLSIRPWRLTDNRGRRNHPPQLPPVPIVKALIMRQHFHRSISVESLMQLLQQSLVRVQYFHLERGLIGFQLHETDLLEAFQMQLLPSLPSSLRRMSLSDTYVVFIPRIEPRHVSPHLARTLASSCVNLEEFSVAAPTKFCAESFLRELAYGKRCDKLQSLCLNYPLLGPQAHQGRVTRTMVLAARAAMSLPALKVMELWSTSLTHACLFRYTVEGSTPTVTWMQAGMEFAVDTRARAAWEKVAFANERLRPLRIVMTPLPDAPEEIAATAGMCILHHMLLRDLALDPVTVAHSEAIVRLYLRSLNRV